MKNLFFGVLCVFFLIGCNDESDVVLITDRFDYVAEFEQRGLSVNVFRTAPVKNQFEGTALETNNKVLALKYVEAINHMATGTVYLDIPEGYDAVFKALNKYTGRKFYCKSYSGRGVPEGCILSYSAYDLLDSIAPVSRSEWVQSQPEAQILPSAVIGYTVYISDPGKLKLSAKLAAAHRDKLSISAYPILRGARFVGDLEYYCERYYARCESFDGYHIVRLKGVPENDAEMGALIVGWMDGLIRE